MNAENTPIQKGLPGLRVVREHLGLTQKQVGNLAKCSPDFVRFVESGRSDCRQEVQRQIASALRCKVTDLLEPPETDRLDQIAIDFKRQELEQLEAGEQKGVA